MGTVKIYTTWVVCHDKKAKDPIEKIESVLCFPYSNQYKSQKVPDGYYGVVFDSYEAADKYMEKLRQEAEVYEREHYGAGSNS